VKPHIRSGILANFIPAVEELGADPYRVVEQAGLQRDILGKPDNYIPYQGYLSLLNTASRLTACPHFGLHLGSTLGSENLGVTGFVMSQADSVGNAWRTLARFYHVHDTYGNVSLTESGELGFVRYEIPDIRLPGARISLDVAAAITANIHLMFLGPDYQALAVQLPYPEPQDLSPYTALCSKKLLFEQPGYATIIALEDLQQPISHSDPQMQGILADYLSRQGPGKPQGTSQQVEELIKGFLATRQCTVEHVARFMSTSIRTLQHRLEQEHTTFHALVEKVRRNLALRYLSEGEMQLTQVALLLGYSELSAFSRSFKRWYGCSPRQWRHGVGQAVGVEDAITGTVT
jgi:AraC-like DNA-binding protein